MAYPPAYVRAFSFTDFEVNFPGEPKPGDELDNEYDNVSNALTATQTNLALIQRADGALANDSVGEDQLQDGIFDGIADGITADAEAAAAAAQGFANAAAGSASSAASSASAASASAATASGAAAQAGVSQGIAQSAANDAALSAADAFDSAQIAANAGNEAQGFRNEAEGFADLAFDWAEKLEGPVFPAPPGWPEAVDDGMFSSKWWAIRARDYMTVSHLDLGSGQTDIGAAMAEWLAIPGNEMPLGLVYATWGSPPLEYALTDPSDPTNPDSWTLISGGPGPPGPPNTLTIGTVTNSGVGGPANATITGVAPDQVLNLTLPTGATGPAGPNGAAGPPNALAIGTVTTGAPGSPADATITGISPSQTLNLTIPQGPQGIQGIQGPPGIGSLADPTALIGLVAIPGVSTAAIRADGAPALSQAINPTWTAQHNFTVTGVGANSAVRIMAAEPSIFFNSNGASADNKFWDMYAGTAHFVFRAINDASSIAQPWLVVRRTGAAITGLEFGNATNNPTYNFLGSGLTTMTGSLQVNGDHIALANTDVYIETKDTDAAADAKVWWIRTSAGNWSLQTRTDIGGPGVNALTFTRTGTAVTQMLVGPDGTTALPGITWLNDNDTGLTRPLADTMVFATAGAEGVRVLPSGGLQITGTNTGGHRAAPGLEIAVNTAGTMVVLIAYNRTTSAYLPLQLNCTYMDLNGPGSCELRMQAHRTIQDAGDGFLRLNPTSDYGSGVYCPNQIRTSTRFVCEDGVANAANSLQIYFNTGQIAYGSVWVDGSVGGFRGIAVNDGGLKPIFMANNNNYGIFSNSEGGRWLIVRDTTTTASTGMTFSAPSFVTTSARASKRETGAPSKPAGILARLRPLLYRLLDGDDREQLGLIAEEVHEVCPQLSDGKTVAYDRLAILLLAAWQDEHAEAA